MGLDPMRWVTVMENPTEAPVICMTDRHRSDEDDVQLDEAHSVLPI
jgi:hypothetical protein